MRRRWQLGAIAVVVLAATLASPSVRALQSSRPAAGPPMPFEDRGACPGEGCIYREWTTRAAVTVRVDRRASAPVAFRLPAREKVMALTGVVVTLKAGRVQFRRAADLSTATSRIHIEPGQTLFLLTYQGEGVTKAWFNGRYYTDVDGVDFLNAACEVQPDRCAGKVVERSRTEWWVQVRNRAGAVGWTNEPEKFDGKDALGGG